MNGRQKLAAYLQENGVQFSVESHAEAFTARDVAASEHIPAESFVKVVIARADGRMVMFCLPAADEVDLDAAAEAVGAEQLDLAEEKDFAPTFDDCEVGAMPPFGNLYDVPVYMEEELARLSRLVFNAGNHHETFSMFSSDYRRLVQPKEAHFSRHLV